MAAPRIGHKLRTVREARGLSQTQMATHLEMGQQGYSCYETDLVPMPLAKFLRFCAICGLSTDELLAIPDPQESAHVTV